MKKLAWILFIKIVINYYEGKIMLKMLPHIILIAITIFIAAPAFV